MDRYWFGIYVFGLLEVRSICLYGSVDAAWMAVCEAGAAGTRNRSEGASFEGVAMSCSHRRP